MSSSSSHSLEYKPLLLIERVSMSNIMQALQYTLSPNPTIIVRAPSTGDSVRDIAVVACNPLSNENVPFRIMLLDASDFRELCDRNSRTSFHLNTVGYVTKDGRLCHRSVMNLTPSSTDYESLSVDHIDRIRCDNRRENLRPATQSDQNLNQFPRSDRRSYDELCRALGIDHLPRSIRWDGGEEKFTCKDHPLYDIARRNGIRVDPSGTKSERVSLVNKFRSCLEAAIRMFTTLEENGVDFADPLDDVRVRLANEYNAIVRFAHEQDPRNFPDGPYADVSKLRGSCQRDSTYYRSFLEALPPLQESESMGGPRELSAQCFLNPRLDAVACFKGDLESYPFVWDVRHNDVLETLTIDRGDGRVHLANNVRDALDLHWWKSSRIHLTELVYHVLERRPVSSGFTVVPFNQIRKDVRVENLYYVRGEPKNFKPSVPVQEKIKDIDIGYPFLPRGVTIFVPDAVKHPDRFEFHVRAASSFLREDGSSPPGSRDFKVVRKTAYKDNARQVFQDTVLPLLQEADPCFTAKNEKYQRLLTEYHEMASIGPVRGEGSALADSVR